MKNKIVEFDNIGKILNKLRKQGKKIVHCHGVFDLIHPGHIRHFQAAKKYGDILIVSITEDKNVNKGPDRPIFNENLRAENIAALQFVNYVTINRFPTAITAIEAIKPDFYAKGQDYKNLNDDITGGILEEKNKVEEFGGKLIITDEIQFSSSRLINQHLDNNDKQITKYLNNIRENISFNHIKKIFEDISKYRVLIIGDVILDEYQFVNPLGKASKSATITAQKLNHELYAGGVLAVANHIADFVKKVTLISSYGINNNINYYEFISKHLHKKVNWKSIFIPDRPTTLKRRFIDPVFKHKLFEVIELDDSPLSSSQKNELTEKIDSKQEYDLIILADFGHGLIDKEVINRICYAKSFVAVNAQTNSANTGFNLITKYPRCDYFSIDKEEAMFALQDRFCDIGNAIRKLSNKLKTSKCAITLGVEGCMLYNSKNNLLINAPTFSSNVLDTIGAGDAFLSITSLLAKQGASIQEIGFIGNAVGNMAAQILGNKSYIKKIPLLKYLKTLLT